MEKEKKRLKMARNWVEQQREKIDSHKLGKELS
jgi:hypothetical protein